MRTTDTPEQFVPLGKAIPAPTPPAPAPAVDGKFIRHPDGTISTRIPTPSLKWVGELADQWRGIHAIQAADMSVIREIDNGRKADRD